MNIARRLGPAALAAVALALVTLGPQRTAAQTTATVKIGLLATLTGPLALPGADGVRGAQTAVDEFTGQAGGKTIVIVKESTDATPNVARDAARKLIEAEDVDFIVGPLAGDEGLAVRDYAKTVPNKTFLNGAAATEDATLFDPAPNFFRWNTDGVQWMAGLGTYAFRDRHYKRVVTLGEDYSYPYSQVGGFTTEFCAAGGHVLDHLWVPLGTKDFSSVIASIPPDVDAVYTALVGADGLNFLKQYVQFGGKAPLIAGSSMVDQLLIEQRLAVATDVAERLAIMVNGTIALEIGAKALLADAEAQRRYLGIGSVPSAATEPADCKTAREPARRPST